MNHTYTEAEFHDAMIDYRWAMKRRRWAEYDLRRARTDFKLALVGWIVTMAGIVWLACELIGKVGHV